MAGLWILVVFASSSALHVSCRIALWRRRAEVFSLLIWTMVVALSFVLQRGPGARNHLIMTAVLVVVFFIELVHSQGADQEKRALLAGASFIIAFDALRSLTHLLLVPGLPRAVMASDADASFVIEQARVGVGDYDLYTSNALLLPMIMGLAIASRGRLRLALAISALAVAAAILLSTFAGAILLGLIGTVIVIGGTTFNNLRRVRYLLPRLAGLAFAALLMWPIGAAVADVEQVQFITDKISRLSRGVADAGIVEGDQTGRGVLFTVSLGTFLSNPLIGIGPVSTVESGLLYAEIGGHSSWIDQLAEYGMLGFAPFLVLVFLRVRRIWSLRRGVFSEQPLAVAGLASAICFLIAGVVNPIIFIPNALVAFFMFTTVVAGQRYSRAGPAADSMATN